MRKRDRGPIDWTEQEWDDERLTSGLSLKGTLHFDPITVVGGEKVRTDQAPQIGIDRKLLFKGESLDVSPGWFSSEDTALWLVSGHNALYQVQSCNSDIVRIVKELSQQRLS